MKPLKNILQHNYIYIILVIISVIYSFINTNIIEKTSIYNEGINTLIGKVIEIGETDNNIKLKIKSKENIIGYYSNKNIDIELGDVIKIIGILEEPEEYSVFNLFSYKKYLKNENIFYIMKIDNIKILKKNANIFCIMKNKIIELISNRKTSDYLYAFILGDSSYINKEVMKSYQYNGVSHLFAVSGMHISLIALLLTKFFKKDNILIIIILFIYMFLTGFIPSIIRAGLFFILLFLNKKYKCNIKNTNILFITLVISLFIKPILLFKVGFQYSFIISLFLLFSNKITNQKSKTLNLLLVSTIAFLASFPISINNFFEINILGILYNLIFVPLVSMIIFPLSIVISIIKMLDPILLFLINIMEYISLFLYKINFGTIIFGKLNIIVVIIYYLLLYLIVKKFNIKNIILFFSLLILIYNQNYFNFNIEVTFIDVGQGDSALIKLPNNKGNILIDTGGKLSNNYSLGKEVIVKYIKSNGIRSIDYLILTHGDYDHLGEALDIMDEIKIKHVVINDGPMNDNEKNIIEKSKKYSLVKAGDKLNMNNYIFNIISPTEIVNDENDDSIVIFTKLKNITFLFTGDISKNSELKILNKYKIQTDILKVGHHGSSTSSCKEFIDKINPKYGIISVGKKNKYNHPDKEVLNYLNNKLEKVYLTSENGSIKFVINNNLKIYTSK